MVIIVSPEAGEPTHFIRKFSKLVPAEIYCSDRSHMLTRKAGCPQRCEMFQVVPRHVDLYRARKGLAYTRVYTHRADRAFYFQANHARRQMLGSMAYTSLRFLW